MFVFCGVYVHDIYIYDMIEDFDVLLVCCI